MSFAMSTKVKLLSLLEDMEILSKSLLEAMNCQQQQQQQEDQQQSPQLVPPQASPPPPPPFNCECVAEQLRQKEAALHSLRRQAARQQAVQVTIERLRVSLEQRDQEIAAYQRQLKEADRLLTSAIYYSRRKLDSLHTSRQNPVDSEELVRFAHRISASGGVSAPLGWSPLPVPAGSGVGGPGGGDPRRPYPTPAEMERGFLRYIDELGRFRPEIYEAVANSTSDRVRAAAPPSNASSLHPPSGATPHGIPPHSASASVTSHVDGGSSASASSASAAGANRADEVENGSSDSTSSSSSED